MNEGSMWGLLTMYYKINALVSYQQKCLLNVLNIKTCTYSLIHIPLLWIYQAFELIPDSYFLNWNSMWFFARDLYLIYSKKITLLFLHYGLGPSTKSFALGMSLHAQYSAIKLMQWFSHNLDVFNQKIKPNIWSLIDHNIAYTRLEVIDRTA